jgi:drug/metabolite transporter (DMT)-like permease
MQSTLDITSMSESLASKPSLTRKLFVTLGLSAGGTLVGGAAGALAFLIAAMASGIAIPFDALWIFAIPAALGAFLGFVLTPIASWMLLRRVPLGRAFPGLAVGTIAGGVLGGLFLHGPHGLEGTIVSAVLGFFVAAVVLRCVSSRREALP